MRPRTTPHPQSGPRPAGPVQGSGSSLRDDGSSGPPASPRKTEASQRDGGPGPGLESNPQSVASRKLTSLFKSQIHKMHENNLNIFLKYPKHNKRPEMSCLFCVCFYFSKSDWD